MRLSKPTTNIRRPSYQQRRGLRLRVRLWVRLWEKERIWRGQSGRRKEEPKQYQVKEEGLRCDLEGDDQLTKKVMVLGLMKRRFRWWPSWWCCSWSYCNLSNGCWRRVDRPLPRDNTLDVRPLLRERWRNYILKSITNEREVRWKNHKKTPLPVLFPSFMNMLR